jgi:hypothetical protein
MLLILSVCHFIKFGFCKYGKECFRKHEDKVCENGRCKVVECSLRHPRNYRFYLDYHYCKFGIYCKFLHKETKDEKVIEAIEKQLKGVKEKLDEKEKEIKLLTENICEMEKNLSGKIESLVKKDEIIQKDVGYLKAENETLKERIKVQENELSNFKKEVEEMVLGKEINQEESLESESIREDSENGSRTKCDKCEFVGKTEGGL